MGPADVELLREKMGASSLPPTTGEEPDGKARAKTNISGGKDDDLSSHGEDVVREIVPV